MHIHIMVVTWVPGLKHPCFARRSFTNGLRHLKIVSKSESLDLMWVKQCHKLPMTGNGLYYIPPIKMVIWGWFMIFSPTLYSIYSQSCC